MEILKESFIIGASGSNHVFIGMLPMLTNRRNVLFSRHLCVAEFMEKGLCLVERCWIKGDTGFVKSASKSKVKSFCLDSKGERHSTVND